MDVSEVPSGDPRPKPDPVAVQSRWKLGQGDEIVAGLSAIKLLGGGIRYEAYLAWDERMRALVVAKVVRPGLVEDAATLRGLRREIKLLSRLNHPVVVRGFGGEVEGPRPHVLLEHLEGPSLSSLKRRYGPLLPEQLIALGIELCAATHYLASRNLVHLDIKPSNVIVGAPPRLIDLSVARTIEECSKIRSPVGTDAYMAPEQALASPDQLGPPADVWGIGATLYEASAGRRPFAKGDRRSPEPEERFPQITGVPDPLPSGTPAAIAEPILSCLRRDPDERPSPAELGDRLQTVLDGLPKPKLASLKPRRR